MKTLLQTLLAPLALAIAGPALAAPVVMAGMRRRRGSASSRSAIAA